MAKDPAFLFYHGDFMQGTQHFTREEKGAYLDLLILQFNEGHMSLDLVRRCLNGDFERLWPFLQKKFEADENGFFFNKRLDDEKFKRANYTASRRKNLESNPDMGNHIDTHMPEHMENENRNKDINVIGIEKGVQGEKQTNHKTEIHDLLFTDDLFIKRLKDSYPGKDYHRGFNECYDYHSVRPNPPNMLWIWKQKLQTWLGNMKSDTPVRQPKKKVTLKDIQR
jgi:uncharacterized protein YdaU (DUF1376 family)